MHFYDSIIVFERGKVEQPRHEKIGFVTKDDQDWRPEPTGLRRLIKRR